MEIVPQFKFKKATRQQAKARIAFAGPSGSGKTYTGLVAATALADGGKIAVIDTERGSASLYSDIFEFDVLELEPPFSPVVYKRAIQAAEKYGYDVILIDSLTHAWDGEGGALDLADEATARMRTPNSYTAWREVTPLHREMVDAILQSKAHIVATMRSKTEYAMDKVGEKTVIRKVGMAPIQRAGMEYEFTIVGDMELDNKVVISKSRYAPFQGKVQLKPTVEFFKPFVDWLNSGEATPEAETQQNPVQSTKQAGTSYQAAHITEKPADDFKPFTIEDACKVTNSKGVQYGTMTDATLKKILSALWKQIKENNLDPETKADIEIKIKAANMILEARERGEIS